MIKLSKSTGLQQIYINKHVLTSGETEQSGMIKIISENLSLIFCHKNYSFSIK